MAIEPADFLEVASALLGENKEANHRSSASRAYYAAYHFCRPLAEGLPRVRSGGKGTHHRLVDRLRKHAVEEKTKKRDFQIRVIGNSLEKGRLLRTDADYHIGRGFSRANAEEMIHLAEKIQQLVQELAQP